MLKAADLLDELNALDESTRIEAKRASASADTHLVGTACNPELATLPSELATLKGRVNRETLRDGIRRLCASAPQTGDQLATLLGKDRDYLRNKHLIPMVREGTLRFRYPESAKHPHQAYVSSGTEGKNHG